MREEWKFNGRPPLLLAGVEEAVLFPLLKSHAAGQAILTRSTRERDRLKAELGTELVFTIAEAKGLEFETVVLWKFCAEEQANRLWKGIASGLPVEQPRVPHLRHELALLYVAATRARSSLIIYRRPGPLGDLGHRFPFVAGVPHLGHGQAGGAHPPRLRAGGVGGAGGLFPAAGALRGGQRMLQERGGRGKGVPCIGDASGEAGELRRGGAPVRGGGRPGEGSGLLHAGGPVAAALALWRALGEQRKILECSARVHEEEGKLALAAGEWEELGEEDRALTDWEKAGAFDRVGRALAARGENARAAKLLEKAGLFAEGAAALLKIGRDGQAGDLYYRAGDFKNAARCFRKVGDDEKELRCLRHMGDPRAVALFHQKRGETRKAIEAFAAFAGAGDANRAALAAMIPEVKTSRSALSAAIMYAALGMPEKAGPLFLRAGEHSLAARELEKAGDFTGLSDSYAAMGRSLDAAHALEKASLPPAEMIEKLIRLLDGHLDAAGPE